MTREETIITAALLAKPPHVVQFSYRGQPRTVNPHALARADKTHELFLHGWQVDGNSSTGREVPCWGNFHLEEMAGLVITEETFDAPQGDYNPGAFRHVIRSL